MHGAILHMGYHPTVRVAKTRRTATLEHCSLCVDDLEGVGAFLELECMAPDHMPAEAIHAELAALVASFGVTAVRTDETYDSLVRSAQVLSDVRHEHLAIPPLMSTAVAVLSRPPATEPCACDMVVAAAVTPHLRRCPPPRQVTAPGGFTDRAGACGTLSSHADEYVLRLSALRIHQESPEFCTAEAVAVGYLRRATSPGCRGDAMFPGSQYATYCGRSGG